MKTPEILDAIKTAQGVESDYAVANLLDVTRSAVSKYRLGRSHFDDATAIRAAKLAGLDAGYVIACAHAERANSDAERAAWKSILSRLAAAVFVAPTLLFMPTPSHAAPMQKPPVIASDVQAVTVIRSRQRLLSSILSALFGPRLAA